MKFDELFKNDGAAGSHLSAFGDRRHAYVRKMIAMAERREITVDLAGIMHVAISHDAWCGCRQAPPTWCNCEPKIELLREVPR